MTIETVTRNLAMAIEEITGSEDTIVDEAAKEEHQGGGHGTEKVLKVEIEMSIDIWKQTIKNRIQVIKHIKPHDKID